MGAIWGGFDNDAGVEGSVYKIWSNHFKHKNIWGWVSKNDTYYLGNTLMYLNSFWSDIWFCIWEESEESFISRICTTRIVVLWIHSQMTQTSIVSKGITQWWPHLLWCHLSHCGLSHMRQTGIHSPLHDVRLFRG